MNHGEYVKTNGQLAYEAFCSAGRMIPEPWELKDKFERAMWGAAAKAVAAVEREACALICDGRSNRPFVEEGLLTETEWAAMCWTNEVAADSIRARSD